MQPKAQPMGGASCSRRERFMPRRGASSLPGYAYNRKEVPYGIQQNWQN